MFTFEETGGINRKPIEKQKVMSVDLGLNSACVCTVMNAEGTVLGRRFLSLPKEEDSLKHVLNRIKKAQQHRGGSVKSLWAVADGIKDAYMEGGICSEDVDDKSASAWNKILDGECIEHIQAGI